MYRDFTYVEDLVKAISLLMKANPNEKNLKVTEGDSLSSVAPFRVLNIGNSDKVMLLDFIDAIEEILKIKAVRNYCQCKWEMSTLPGRY